MACSIGTTVCVTPVIKITGPKNGAMEGTGSNRNEAFAHLFKRDHLYLKRCRMRALKVYGKIPIANVHAESRSCMYDVVCVIFELKKEQ